MESLEDRELLATLAGVVNEFPVTAPNSGVAQITTGPDGALWFTETNADVIGRLSLDGVLTEFPIPTFNAGPQGIVAGPDGALWFTEQFADQIGRITTGGAITEFALPNTGSAPFSITNGPDGNLYFTEQTGDRIGRITPFGAITEFGVPTADALPTGIATGGDGNLWFTEAGATQIGILSPQTGQVAEVTVPDGNPNQIARGVDGNLYFTFADLGAVGRVTTSGVVSVVTTPTASSSTGGITLGGDGGLYFTEPDVGQIGRLDLQGNITELALDAGSIPEGIAIGPDGNVYFTDTGNNAIGQIDLQIPTITAIYRLGNRRITNGVVLAFSQPLDPLTAQDFSNYLVTTPGRNGVFDTPDQVFAGRTDDHYLHFQQIAYDASLQTVTIVFTEPVRNRTFFRLFINGSFPLGVTSTSGSFLNGGLGEGSNFDITLRGINLPIFGDTDTVASVASASTARAGRHHLRASVHPKGAAHHLMRAKHRA